MGRTLLRRVGIQIEPPPPLLLPLPCVKAPPSPVWLIGQFAGGSEKWVDPRVVIESKAGLYEMMRVGRRWLNDGPWVRPTIPPAAPTQSRPNSDQARPSALRVSCSIGGRVVCGRLSQCGRWLGWFTGGHQAWASSNFNGSPLPPQLPSSTKPKKPKASKRLHACPCPSPCVHLDRSMKTDPFPSELTHMSRCIPSTHIHTE